MSYFNRFMDNMRVKLPGALDGAIHLELFNTLDDICRTVDLYLTPVDLPLTVGVQSYIVVPPTGAVPITFYAIAHETFDVRLLRASPQDATVTFPGPVDAETAATPLVVKMTFAPDPVAAASQWLPEVFWRRAYDPILHGTLYRMMAQPAKPYSNPQIAVAHARASRHGKSRIKRDNTTGPLPGGVSWSFPRFA